MKTTDLKTKIRAHLANSGEATAKQIAKAIGHADYPTDVINALSDMRTSAEVECEKKKGKGNELWYWLIKAESNESAELSNLREQLKNAETQRDVHFAKAEHYEQRLNTLSDDLIRFFIAVQQVTGAPTKPVSLADCETQIAAAVATLRGQIDEVMNAAADGIESAVDVKDAAVGYIVRVTGKKPRICAKPESAHAAAMSSARAHGRAEVLALVPVGKAVRGAEWKDAA